MQIQSERAREIDAYLESHPSSQIGKWPIEISGKKEILFFYRFPRKILRYNINNGRFSMEKQEWEVKNPPIDADQPEGAHTIRSLLLDLDKDKTKSLKDDLRKKGQMEPGVITFDGIVINGNRRLAIIEDLQKEDPSGKWDYIEAVRLPRDVSEGDLWKIEAGLQLSMDKVAEYHPVNELLKIKQGIDAGLKPEEIAAAMYGRTVDYVKESLDRLNLIENFLNFFGAAGNYGLIKTFGLHEYFIDLQERVLKPKGLSSQQRTEQLKYSFILIRANIVIKKPGAGKKRSSITHSDIRKIGEIFSDAHARGAALNNISKTKDAKEVDPDIVIDDFKSAIDQLNNQAQRDEPIKLIEKAIKALNSIDRKSEHFREERVAEAMSRLSKLVSTMMSEIAN